MTINLKAPDEHLDLRPKITVFGVGGAGGNAVNNMIQAGLEGVEFVVANTDNQALAMSSAERRIQMGTAITEGLGAGSRPQIGGAAAEEAMPEILDQVSGSHMAFITAGMGGGTGTGAAPVIARLAREQGILTIGVVTKPFQFEGARRMDIAEAGIEELQKHVDTLIVIPNQNLFRVANERTTFADAFAMADQVLYSGVAGITDLMVKEGLINLDFADVQTVMQGMGKAMMGTGEATGEKRAIEAAEAAIANPLLDDVSMKGARALLISITGGEDLTLYEVDEAATRIRQEIDPDANIILGATFDQSLEGYVRVSVVATGIDGLGAEAEEPSYPGLSSTVPESTYSPAPLVNTSSPHGEIHAPQMEAPVEDHYGTDAGVEAAEAGYPSHRRYEDDFQAPADNGIRQEEAPAGLPPLPRFAPAGVAAQDREADVTIRRIDVGDNMASPPPVSRAPGPQTPAVQHDPRQPFLPPEAQNVPRPARMPTVDDLPMPVQQQIHAQRSGERPHHGVEKQKRRTGFLERLANVGRGRRVEEDEATVSDEPRLAPARRQPPPAHTFSAPEQPIIRPAGPVAAEPRVQDQEEDQLEIPAFLRRQQAN